METRQVDAGESVSSVSGEEEEEDIDFSRSLSILWMQTFKSTLNVELHFRDLDSKVQRFRVPFEVLSGSKMVMAQMRQKHQSFTAAQAINTSREAKKLLRGLKSTLGLQTENIGGKLVIKAILSGSPAYDSKLREGDVLRKIDSHVVEGKDSELLMEYLITRTPGASVSFEVSRNGVFVKLWMVVGAENVSRHNLALLCRKASGAIAKCDVMVRLGRGLSMARSNQTPSSLAATPSTVINNLRMHVFLDAASFSLSITGDDEGAISASGLIFFLAFLENLPVLQEYNYAVADKIIFDLEASSGDCL
eukprot:jgi/Bigna1/143059/aug1.75_g17767